MRAPLFHRAYGDALSRLPLPVVRVHDIGAGCTWRGVATVTVGPSLLARAVSVLAGLPPAGQVPVVVHMEPNGDGETWRRKFGDHPMATHLRAGRVPGTIEETLWPVTAISRLEPDEAGVNQVLIGLCVLGVPLPHFLWPELDIRESAEGGVYRFKVVMALWGERVGAYEGWLETPKAA